MESQEEIVNLLKRIFDRFLEKNFVTADSVYFEKLIVHLSAKENVDVVHQPFALEWIDKCLTLITEDFNQVHPKVVAFVFNFCNVVMQNEWIVMKIKELEIANRVLAILDRDIRQFNASMKLGSIRFLKAISTYTFGLFYLCNTKAWRFLINFCNKDHTLYVVREARELLYDLLYKYSVKMKNEEVVLEILDMILKPIIENVYEENNVSIMVNVFDSKLQHKLSSTLDLISYILQQTIQSEKKTNIVNLCRNHHRLEINLWKLHEMTKDPNFTEKIMKGITSINFAKLIFEKWDSGQIAPEDFDKFGVCFYNTLKFCLERQEFKNFLKISELNHILWKKLGNRAPQEIQIENQRVRFENQLIVCQIMPVFFIVKEKELQNEECFEQYREKLLNDCCEQTFRMCYSFRDHLCDNDNKPPPTIGDLAQKSIHGVLAMEKALQHDQAVTVFQALMYALKEFVMSSYAEMNNSCMNGESSVHFEQLKSTVCGNLVAEIPNVLSAIFSGLQTLIKRYRITWKESIETICLVNCLAAILQNSALTTRLAVQAIKLVQLAIEHFLSPNMALLVDNLHGSGLVSLSPIIVNRFHDNDWEVRDSTLELVTSMVNISRLKYPAFQQFLVESKICPLVYEMAKHDGETYVRASALKCISCMISINLIWDKHLSNLKLVDHLFDVLNFESEGIVRMEGINALMKVYDHRKLPACYNDKLYSTLSKCVVKDLYWEVKVNALNFWRLEIQKQFTNQGMIDGTFPTVTFSKENKKIVTLTEKEIKLRIMKAFNELSQRGCLGVILYCLRNDSDLEVVRAAVCIVHCMLENLKKYDYESICNEADVMTNPTSNESKSNPFNQSSMNNISDSNIINCNGDITVIEADDFRLNAEEMDMSDVDQVIDQIIGEKDINYVIKICNESLGMSSFDNEKKTHIDDMYYKKFATVSAKEFITTIKDIDFNKLLNVQQEWLIGGDSFKALLDDILVAVEPVYETIISDCY